MVSMRLGPALPLSELQILVRAAVCVNAVKHDGVLSRFEHSYSIVVIKYAEARSGLHRGA
jgi:hypothetical protein